MSSLNRCMLIGRLGQDPECRFTNSNTAVATLNIATSERYKDKNGERQESTEWHSVTAWGRTAEICQQYLTKGSLVYIEGPIKTRKWQDKDGNDRYSTEITALQLTMLDSRNSQGSLDSSGSANSAPTAEKPNSSLPDNFDDMDPDLPFAWLLMIGGAGLMQVILNSGMV